MGKIRFDGSRDAARMRYAAQMRAPKIYCNTASTHRRHELESRSRELNTALRFGSKSFSHRDPHLLGPPLRPDPQSYSALSDLLS